MLIPQTIGSQEVVLTALIDEASQHTENCKHTFAIRIFLRLRSASKHGQRYLKCSVPWRRKRAWRHVVVGQSDRPVCKLHAGPICGRVRKMYNGRALEQHCSLAEYISGKANHATLSPRNSFDHVCPFCKALFSACEDSGRNKHKPVSSMCCRFLILTIELHLISICPASMN